MSGARGIASNKKTKVLVEFRMPAANNGKPRRICSNVFIPKGSGIETVVEKVKTKYSHLDIFDVNPVRIAGISVVPKRQRAA